MNIFGVNQGALVKTSFSTQPGAGAMLKFPDDTWFGNSPNGDSVDNPCIVTRINCNFSETYQVVKCFNENRFIYAFGNDPDNCVVDISFIAFTVSCNLGDTGKTADTANKLIKTYALNRLSQQTKTKATLVLKGLVIHGFIIGGTVNYLSGDSAGLLDYSIKFLVPDIQSRN